MFYQGVPIDNCKNVPDPVSQYSSDSEYNASCTAGMALTHSSIINNKLLNNDTDVVP